VAALAAFRLPPAALIVEVTETSVLADPVRIGAVLERLGELGVGVALDDFGTGYSSLTHLKQLPVSEVKAEPRPLPDGEMRVISKGPQQLQPLVERQSWRHPDGHRSPAA